MLGFPAPRVRDASSPPAPGCVRRRPHMVPSPQRLARSSSASLFFFAAVAMGSLLATSVAHAQPTDPPPTSGGQQQPPTTGGNADPKDNLLPQDPTGTPAVDPAKDQQKLVQQGRERPTADGSIGARPSEVYSEDWWAHTRPILELHGYFRTRGEL